MIDLQSTLNKDNALNINRVGIKDLKYPIQLALTNGRVLPTIANFTMAVNLPAEQRGTHMSRFIEVLEQKSWIFSDATLTEFMLAIAKKLNSNHAYLNCEFTYFMQKAAPISQATGLLDYQIALDASFNVQAGNNALNTNIHIKVPVTTLCPCSKEISDFGAHNQRSIITITLNPGKLDKIEDIIKIAEQQSSCAIYSILKRPDEKFVTEQAYLNPCFVEDIVRKVATQLHEINYINNFTITAENFESIHNHSAYATITS